MNNIEVGTMFRSQTIVGNDMFASHLGSGNLEVYATPAMIGMMENAAMNCIARFLGENESSVGSKISVSHLSPTPAGVDVYAIATVTATDGKRVDFSIEAFDSFGKIGEGTHTRYIVDCKKFMTKANSKSAV